MEKLLRCKNCGYTVHEGDIGDKCHKCGASRDQFEELSEEAVQKIYNADTTNDIHMDIIGLSMAIDELAREGIELNLDPDCVTAFEKAISAAWEIKQISKAEIAAHLNKGEW